MSTVTPAHGQAPSQELPPSDTAPGEAGTALPADAQAASPSRYLNRHVSWLDFNARVLALAEDPDRPVLERTKFLAIFSSNLDEFFQVRVGGLVEQEAAGYPQLSPDGMTPAEQLAIIRERVLLLTDRQMRVFAELVRRLDAAGIRFSDYEALDEDDRQHLDRVFEEEIFPVLTPLAVDPTRPFPYISNLSLNLAVVLSDPRPGCSRIARVKVPPLLPRFVVMPDGERFVPLEQIIALHLDRLFPGMKTVGTYPFRVTRNADFDLEEEAAEDLLAAVETIVRRRRRSPRVVRLEIATTSPEVRTLLLRELEITADQVYSVDGPLDLTGLFALGRLDRPDLKAPKHSPTTPRRLAPAPPAPAIEGGSDLERGGWSLSSPPDTAGRTGSDIFQVLRDGDLLVQFPYEDFATTVEAFVERAASDDQVVALKQTIYRTSGPDSPIVRALIKAAEAGKQVVALVELTARFDEEANIAWSRVLEEAGVHVVYGLDGLKTHAKICLVVRREGGALRRYVHVGTGNYNPETSRQYEDLNLLSADPALGADLSDLFNYLTGYSQQRRYRHLLIAPITMRRRLLELIGRQAHRGGRIVIKCNHVVDPEIIDALYRASQKGAEIDIIARSSCGVRPGVDGLSPGIRVRSIVGRFLEHSRVFGFGRDADAEWYIGSADLMARNLDGRVEVVAPVVDPELRARLADLIGLLLADDTQAWELRPDGSWARVPTRAGVEAHRSLEEIALRRGGAVSL